MQRDPNINTKMESIDEANFNGEVSDNVSIYIGGSLIVLGFLNGITDVPDAFIIGASLSGLCFTIVDIVYLGNKSKTAIAVSTGLGVISLFLLPIILVIYPDPILLKGFGMVSDMGTFYALGIVMITLGVKSSRAKRIFITETIEVVRFLKDRNDRLGEEIVNYKQEQMEIRKEHEEIKKEHYRKLAEFEEELEKIKEVANKTNPN